MVQEYPPSDHQFHQDILITRQFTAFKEAGSRKVDRIMAQEKTEIPGDLIENDKNRYLNPQQEQLSFRSRLKY